MNLTYEQRMALLEIVKREASEQFSVCHEIDQKFKGDDTTMRNDKRDYWMHQQDQAYKKWDMLISIRDALRESV
jgi:hypothetical protein